MQEARQLHNTLIGKSEGWKNHPALKMWIGHANGLALYHNIFLDHCINVHKIKVEKSSFIEIDSKVTFPWWIGNKYFIAAHKSNLLRKNESFYRQYGWTEPLDLPYIWPNSNLEKKCKS